MNKGNRNKLKTLPSQAIHPNQQFLYQSQSDDTHIKNINVASPTFATNDLSQAKFQNQSNKNILKENKITLNLRQLRIDDNNGIRASKQKQNCYDQNKKSDIVFLREQNDKVIQKCRNLTQTNKQLQKQNGILNEKLKQCKKCVQQKFNHVSKYLQMPNSSPTQSNIDLYLQVKSFKEYYKQLQHDFQVILGQNNLLNAKVHQLQTIINAHTQKSLKKKLQKDQTGQKLKNIQRQLNQKIQQLKRKSQIKYKQLQTQIKQKQKIIKKTKDEYQKLKFLKQEIEKKRQQDMKIKQDLENRIKQKQYLCVSSKQQLTKLQEQYNLLSNKFQVSHTSTESIQQQLNKCQDQLNKMCLKLSSLQAENNKYRHNLQNYKLINQKYNQQLNQKRKQNQVFYQNVQTLKLQKDKLQSIIAKHTSAQDRKSRRILQLQEKLNEVQKQADQMRTQLDQFIKSSSRNYPNISKFKDDQQGSEKQSTFRVIQNEKTVFNEQQIKNIEQKYNRIVQGLNKQIQQLRKCKEHLQNNIQSQREKYQKINLELQNTYRKIQEFGYTQELQREGMRGEFKEKDRYIKKDVYGISQILPMEFTRATKVTPQLKMIRQILHMIIGSRESDKFNSKPLKCFRDKQRQSPKSIQYLIEQIKKLAEETADLFDDRTKQLQSLVGRIVNKQEIITKLLRFTPQQKKLCILQYLKVMQNIQEYSTQQVFKVTKRLEQQASQWKDTILNLIEVVQKNEQQISEMRKELGKYKNQEMGRKYDSFGGTGIVGVREKQERQKFERDRYQDKYIYRRY